MCGLPATLRRLRWHDAWPDALTETPVHAGSPESFDMAKSTVPRGAEGIGETVAVKVTRSPNVVGEIEVVETVVEVGLATIVRTPATGLMVSHHVPSGKGSGAS